MALVAAPASSHIRDRVRNALTPREWVSLSGMAVFVVLLHVVLLHVVGWGLMLAIVAPHRFQVSATQVLGVGLGMTAYTLGMRHAFDADHIAAIDNTTRKLRSEGKSPIWVGFWFSLGHSTIVSGCASFSPPESGHVQAKSRMAHQRCTTCSG